MLVHDARWLLLEGRVPSLLAGRAAQAQPFALPREHAAARIYAGIPLLHDQPARLDIQFAADLFARLLDDLRQQPDAEMRPHVVTLVAAVQAGRLDFDRLFNEAFVQHPDHLADIAREVGVDADLLTRLADLAVIPLLRAYAARLRPLLETAVWQRGYCPICGAWPVLAEVCADAAEHTLRCGACGSGWPVPRTASDGSIDVVHLAEPRPSVLPADEIARQRPRGSGFRIELAVPEEEWLDELEQD